ncbi:hypothetical protein LCGC14_2724220, partial [marine sediment metagenome]
KTVGPPPRARANRLIMADKLCYGRLIAILCGGSGRAVAAYTIPGIIAFLAEMENVEALMTGLAEEDAPIRLAASHTMAEFALPGPLVEFESLHERHLAVDLLIANSVVVRELVRDGRAELGVAATDSSDRSDKALEELPFLDDEVVVAVPEAHAWAKVDEIELEDLVSTPMIVRDPEASTRQVVESTLAAEGLSLAPPLAEVGSTSAAKAAALSERVPVLLSRLAVRDAGEGFVARRVRGLRFPRHFALILASEESLTPGARALINHLLQRPRKEREPMRRGKSAQADRRLGARNVPQFRCQVREGRLSR